MKTCYVSIPYGRKVDALGRGVDFDAVYESVLRPAIEAEGLEPLHGTDLDAGAVFHKALFRTILSADVFIADLTTASPNVLYELGLRHALRRGVTILIMAAGSQVPFNVNLVRVLIYHLGADGEVEAGDAARFRDSLTHHIREGLRHASNDSPIYDFFPDLIVDLPEGLAPATARHTRSVLRGGTARSGSHTPPAGGSRGGTQRPPATVRPDPTAQLRVGEDTLRGVQDADPFEYITLMRRYRDQSAWDDVIRVADSLPAGIARAPDALQMLALALNRRGKPGDQERAIGVVESLIGETGGDAESFGVLGRIFKDRWRAYDVAGDADLAAANLARAIGAYRNGFEREPANYYPGINLATLLLLRGAPEDRTELRDVVPRVRAALDAKTTAGREDYWQTATRLELDVLAGDWDHADALAETVARSAESAWMLESTRAQLQLLLPAVESDTDRARLGSIVDQLRTGNGGETHV